MCSTMRHILLFCVLCVLVLSCNGDVGEGFLVRKENRKTLVSTENGEILAARVGNVTSHLLHFFTMDPNSLFLPVILHSDMVFYVHTGSGKLSWTEESEMKTAELRRGDVYGLKEGAVFFIHSNLETEMGRQRLRVIAIFANSNTDLQEPMGGPYSSVRDMVLGFDKKVLQAAFKVSEEEVEELLNGPKPPPIIHEVTKTKNRAWEIETKILGSLMGGRSYKIFESNKKKGTKSTKLFNLFKEDKDFENCNGWSTTVTKTKLSALKDSSIGVFMVNLTAGSMMGPHWNPQATEIAVVLQGRGMVRIVGSSGNETGLGNSRFEVGEGDVFVVPRFHPMAQLGFNNGSFVFMGFSDSERKNHPQFLAGQASVLRTLSRDVLATSLNVRNKTVDRLLGSQEESVILGCLSCAEEEFEILERERERQREEERKKKEEEEAERRREEEEEAKRREEEEKKKREEEEEEKREKEEEEAKKREEEEAEREEEERERQEEEEEEAKRREEEEQKKREEEEEEEREKEEEEAKRREEEEQKKREEEEEEEREKEEEEAKKREEERKRQEEEEAEREEEERERQEEEEEEAKRREEEEQKKREEEEEEAREQEEEEAKRQEEERKRQEEEEEEAREQEEEEAKRQEEERKKREEEEEEKAREQEEEEAERQEEERRRREEEEAEREEEEKERREQEEEEARRREEERRKEEEEEAARQEEERQRREEEEQARREEEEEMRERERERRRERREARMSEEEEAQRQEEERQRRQEEEEARWGEE